MHAFSSRYRFYLSFCFENGFSFYQNIFVNKFCAINKHLQLTCPILYAKWMVFFHRSTLAVINNIDKHAVLFKLPITMNCFTCEHHLEKTKRYIYTFKVCAMPKHKVEEKKIPLDCVSKFDICFI